MQDMFFRGVKLIFVGWLVCAFSPSLTVKYGELVAFCFRGVLTGSLSRAEDNVGGGLASIFAWFV